MSRRISRSFLESAGRKELSRYLQRNGRETYREESVKEMRETALYLFESGEPEESASVSVYE